MNKNSFLPDWRDGGVRDEWAEELLKESRAAEVRNYVRELEEHLRWKDFALRSNMQNDLKKLLGTAVAGPLLRDVDVVAKAMGAEQPLKQVQTKIANLEYSKVETLIDDLTSIAAATSNAEQATKAVKDAFQPLVSETVSGGASKTAREEPTAKGAGTTFSDEVATVEQAEYRSLSVEQPEEDEEGVDMDVLLQEDIREAGVKRSRQLEKENTFDQFKKEQKLHPEYAGIYADAFLAAPLEMHFFRELLVFHKQVRVDTVVGMVQLQPHTTMRELRLLLRDELGLVGGEEELALSRGAFPEDAGSSVSDEAGSAVEAASAAAQTALCPILLTQNHKLACTFFVHPSQVLVFDRPRTPPKNAVLLKELAERAREGERLLVIDVSRGHEPQPIPVFNGADAEPAPMDFTYVTHCVVNEGLRLLLGGPLRDPWPCPYDDVAAAAEDFDGMPYDGERRFVHEPHTVESIFECTLMNRCGMACKNRLVQFGPRYRLEVFRCCKSPGDNQKYVKGWGVRSPDFVPKGSFLCEYIGEYISDDEAESRGIRYDDQKMSRLMDVHGDGKDSVRMCIDATRFSNLGRFLNHSCDPNVFKQRVFCDHNSRLPRIAFFAARDIPPFEELAYDYGYADVPGKTMPCLCGARNCKKLLY